MIMVITVCNAKSLNEHCIDTWVSSLLQPIDGH